MLEQRYVARILFFASLRETHTSPYRANAPPRARLAPINESAEGAVALGRADCP